MEVNTKMDRLSAIKEEIVNEILSSDLTKIEKLRKIEKEQLWGYHKYIQHEFPQWEEEARELVKKEAQRILDEKYPKYLRDICTKQLYHSKMTDSIFDPSTFKYEKYETVSYADALQCVLEEAQDRLDSDDENPMIDVVTTRHPVVSIKKTYNEIVDAVFENAVSNKVVGFINNW